MLFEALDKLRQQTIISSVIFMVVGLFMLVVPAQYDSVVVYTVGCLLIIFGEVMVRDFMVLPGAVVVLHGLPVRLFKICFFRSDQACLLFRSSRPPARLPAASSPGAVHSAGAILPPHAPEA